MAERRPGGPAQRSAAEREISATIKLILSVMEELAGLPPVQACEPYFFEQQRGRVMRRLHIMAEECRRQGRELGRQLAAEDEET